MWISSNQRQRKGQCNIYGGLSQWEPSILQTKISFLCSLSCCQELRVCIVMVLILYSSLVLLLGLGTMWTCYSSRALHCVIWDLSWFFLSLFLVRFYKQMIFLSLLFSSSFSSWNGREAYCRNSANNLHGVAANLTQKLTCLTQTQTRPTTYGLVSGLRSWPIQNRV